jgi:hypothetical protein
MNAIQIVPRESWQPQHDARQRAKTFGYEAAPSTVTPQTGRTSKTGQTSKSNFKAKLHRLGVFVPACVFSKSS